MLKTGLRTAIPSKLFKVAVPTLAERVLEVEVGVAVDGCGGRASKLNTHAVLC